LETLEAIFVKNSSIRLHLFGIKDFAFAPTLDENFKIKEKNGKKRLVFTLGTCLGHPRQP